MCLTRSGFSIILRIIFIYATFTIIRRKKSVLYHVYFRGGGGLGKGGPELRRGGGGKENSIAMIFVHKHKSNGRPMGAPWCEWGGMVPQPLIVTPLVRTYVCMYVHVCMYVCTYVRMYGYMASDIWLRTILIVRKESRCRHIGYSYRLTARVLLYAPSHRQDKTYHGLCYTSRGALAGTRNSSMGPPHEGSIRRPTAP